MIDVNIRLELPGPVEIDNTETRWGRPDGDNLTLHDGRFIVDWERNGELHLADADWDAKRVTFHSTKHGHIVRRDALERAVQAGQVIVLGALV